MLLVVKRISMPGGILAMQTDGAISGIQGKQRKRRQMPYVNVRITKTGVTKAQKAQIVEEITATLQRVLNKKPENTHIVIDEVEMENWGYGGKLTTEY